MSIEITGPHADNHTNFYERPEVNWFLSSILHDGEYETETGWESVPFSLNSKIFQQAFGRTTVTLSGALETWLIFANKSTCNNLTAIKPLSLSLGNPDKEYVKKSLALKIVRDGKGNQFFVDEINQAKAHIKSAVAEGIPKSYAKKMFPVKPIGQDWA